MDHSGSPSPTPPSSSSGPPKPPPRHIQTPPRTSTNPSTSPPLSPRYYDRSRRSSSPVSSLLSYTPPASNTPRSSSPFPTKPEDFEPNAATVGRTILQPPTPIPNYLIPSASNSRSTSRSSSRRASIAADLDKMASGVVKDFKKSVKNVSDKTQKAGHKVVDSSKHLKEDMEATSKKVKDKTAIVGSSMKGASEWVAEHTSKTAQQTMKQAMDQAKSNLDFGEKTTLFLTETISKLSRSWMTHVVMFLAIALYTALGAAAFIFLEAPHEAKEKNEIAMERTLLLKVLYNETIILDNRTDWFVIADSQIKEYENKLYKSFQHGVSSDTDVRVWTFWKTMFFCSTITTTIGYGHITPVTLAGQVLTIVYAIIGIPLMLILLADFGKLFTRILKAIFKFIDKINRSARCKMIKKSSPVLREVNEEMASECDIFVAQDMQEEQEEGTSEDEKTGCCTSIFRFIFCCCGKKRKKDKTPDDEAEAAAEKEKAQQTLEELIDGDQFNLPISLALLILVIYIVIGCCIFTLWEDWSFYEAFYFIFISISTIGFGDLVPKHPGFMMAATVYLIFGLAFTAMTINIIQEKLSNTFAEASKKMKEQFSEIMKKAEEAENEEKAEKEAKETDGDTDDDEDEDEEGKSKKKAKKSEDKEKDKKPKDEAEGKEGSEKTKKKEKSVNFVVEDETGKP